MIQLRPEFNKVLESAAASDREDLYMLLYTRERTLRVLSRTEEFHSRTVDFVEWLKNRDKNYIHHFSGTANREFDLEESIVMLCESILNSSNLPMHWWSEAPMSRAQLIFDFIEEESAFRGEISASLDQPNIHRQE